MANELTLTTSDGFIIEVNPIYDDEVRILHNDGVFTTIIYIEKPEADAIINYLKQQFKL